MTYTTEQNEQAAEELGDFAAISAVLSGSLHRKQEEEKWFR